MYAELISAAVSEVAAPAPPSAIASVWRRLSAYLLDWLLLGFVGGEIGTVFFDRLWRLGLYGICIGFVVGAAYFATLDCWIGKGQTLGKRLLKIKAVDAQGAPLSFERALARYSIFVVPCLLYGWKIPLTRTPLVVSSLLFALTFWVGGSTVYLIMFEKLNRQGLHDLAARSFVVHQDHEGPVNSRPIPQLHWAILGAVLVAATTATVMLNGWADRQPAEIEFHRDSATIENMDGVVRANIGDRLTHGLAAGVSKVMYISISRSTRPNSEEAFACEVVKALKRSDRNLEDYDLIDVRLFYGYDMGITSRWQHHDFAKSLIGWSGASSQ